MVPRLQHRKSRTGCQQCKLRKVKCDELHPTCANCRRHRVACEYLNPFIHSSEDIRAPSNETTLRSPDDSLPGPEIPYADMESIDYAFTAEERRAIELRLLHHFTSIVSYTFGASDEPCIRNIWNIDTVHIAFDHPFLLNAILAISCLHLVSDKGWSSHFYARDKDPHSAARVVEPPTLSLGRVDPARAHRMYLNLAIQQQRMAISSLDNNNAEAVFLTSVLLSYQALKLLPNPSISTAYVLPLRWLRMSNAISTTFDAARPLVPQNSLIETLRSMHSEPDFRNRAVIFNPRLCRPFQGLLDWISHPEPILDDEIKTTYQLALAYVGGVYQGILDKEPPRVLFRRLWSLGIMVPCKFVTLLEEGRPRALAILAHHFAMARVVDDHWWFRGTAEREVNGIRSIMPAEWQWAMEWPLLMLHEGISTV